MNSKKTFAARFLDRLALCICAYLASLFVFGLMGVGGRVLSFSSFVFATLLIALLALGKRRSKRFPGERSRIDSLQTDWLESLMLMPPRECLGAVLPLLAKKYGLSDVEIELGDMPYAKCIYRGERIVFACARTAGADTAICLASIAAREGAEHAVLGSLMPLPGQEAYAGIPGHVVGFGPNKVKELMPVGYVASQEGKGKVKRGSVFSALADEAFSKSKALRYIMYGFGLVMLYLLMGFSYALLPGIACFVLAIASHARPKPRDALL